MSLLYYTCTTSACEQGQQCNSMSLLKEMHDWHIQPNVITYISTSEKGQQWIAAVALLQEIQQWQTRIGLGTYSATISACGNCQQWITAVVMLREMQRFQKLADVITYCATISVCERDLQCIAALLRA